MSAETYTREDMARAWAEGHKAGYGEGWWNSRVSYDPMFWQDPETGKRHDAHEGHANPYEENHHA